MKQIIKGIFVAIIAMACAQKNTNSSIKISNGQPISEVEKQQSLFYIQLETGDTCDADQDMYAFYSCGATRVAEDLFITARHCMYESTDRYLVTDYAKWTEIQKRIGPLTGGDCAKQSDIDNIAANPDNGLVRIARDHLPIEDNLDALVDHLDFALLQIDLKDASRVKQRIVAMADKRPGVGTKLKATGYGGTECVKNSGEYDYENPGVLGAGTAYFYVSDKFSKPYRLVELFLPNFERDQVLVNESVIWSKQYFCGGDSGSGLFEEIDGDDKIVSIGTTTHWHYPGVPQSLNFDGHALTGPDLTGKNSVFCTWINLNSSDLRRPEFEHCFVK